MKYTTVDDIEDYEQKTVINSPRSIEACLREGIRPEDLLYLPPSLFENPENPSDLNTLHYQYFEKKRQELLINVRKTRKKLVNQSQVQTRSSTALSFPAFNNKDVLRERVKNVQAKFIMDKCLREEVVKRNLLLKEVERKLELDKNIDLNLSLAKGIKERTDKEIQMKEERRERVRRESEMVEEGRISYEEKDLQEKMRVLLKMNEKIEAIRKKRRKNEEKARFYKEKVNEQQECIRELRIKNLEENDLEEKKRIGLLISLKTQKQKELETTWNIKIQKTFNLKQDLNKELENKQGKYYEVKKVLDMHFNLRLKSTFEHPKSLEQITGKIPEVTDALLLENEYKKQQLDEKLIQDQRKVQNSRIVKLRKQEYSKKVRSLKLMKQTWNLQRIKNKKDYTKTLIKDKLNESIQKIEELENLKAQDLSQQILFNAKSEKIKDRLSKEVEKMAISKTWDQEKLLKVISYCKPGNLIG